VQHNFEPIIDSSKQDRYLSLLAQTPELASDYSFTNVYGWAEEYQLEWSWQEDYVLIRQNKPTLKYWAPVGNWSNIDWQLYFDFFQGQPNKIIRIPEKLLSLWKGNFVSDMQIDETRDQWDYIYKVSELAVLEGNRFHKKKNLVNQFKKKYDFKYLPFSQEMVTKALEMQTDWCTWKDCEDNATLAAENRVISKILNQWEEIRNLIGGAVMVDGMMVCYTIAEPLTEDMVLIHFEKGNPDYKGSYQAINQMFLDEVKDQFEYVNREQDLGDEGLRKAKMSYHPIAFVKKFCVST
jgi:hypothetical protein